LYGSAPVKHLAGGPYDPDRLLAGCRAARAELSLPGEMQPLWGSDLRRVVP